MIAMLMVCVMMMVVVVMVTVGRYNMEDDGKRISGMLHGGCPTALGIK